MVFNGEYAVGGDIREILLASSRLSNFGLLHPVSGRIEGFYVLFIFRLQDRNDKPLDFQLDLCCMVQVA